MSLLTISFHLLLNLLCCANRIFIWIWLSKLAQSFHSLQLWVWKNTHFLHADRKAVPRKCIYTLTVDLHMISINEGADIWITCQVDWFMEAAVTHGHREFILSMPGPSPPLTDGLTDCLVDWLTGWSNKYMNGQNTACLFYLYFQKRCPRPRLDFARVEKKSDIIKRMAAIPFSLSLSFSASSSFLLYLEGVIKPVIVRAERAGGSWDLLTMDACSSSVAL